LAQLRSHHFEVLYYPYDSVKAAFATVGIDASFEESTSDEELRKKVDAYKALSDEKREKIVCSLRKRHSRELSAFLESLRTTLKRSIRTVVIIPLHGRMHKMGSLKRAIDFLGRYDEKISNGRFMRYELIVRYSNGDEVRGEFGDKSGALHFLNSL